MFDVNVQDDRVTVDDWMFIPPPATCPPAVFDLNVQDVRVTVDDVMIIPPPCKNWKKRMKEVSTRAFKQAS